MDKDRAINLLKQFVVSQDTSWFFTPSVQQAVGVVLAEAEEAERMRTAASEAHARLAVVEVEMIETKQLNNQLVEFLANAMAERDSLGEAVQTFLSKPSQDSFDMLRAVFEVLVEKGAKQ